METLVESKGEILVPLKSMEILPLISMGLGLWVIQVATIRVYPRHIHLTAAVHSEHWSLSSDDILSVLV